MISDLDLIKYYEDYLRSDTDDQRSIINYIIPNLLEQDYINFSARIVYLLRNEGRLEDAEKVVLPILEHDSYRDLACWEMGYGFGVAGQPHKAIHYLSKAIEAQPKWEWMLWLAVQQAITNQAGEASETLLRVEREHPELSYEIAIHRQFFTLLGSFGREAAYDLLRQVRSLFASKSIVELEADIRTALDRGDPYLLLRLGDGEGACIRLSADDERANLDYYRANRDEFADIWFKDKSVLDDPAFIKVLDDFNAVIRQADAIGGSTYEAAIVTEYDYASRRGIAWVVNVMRALIGLADRDPAWAQRVPIYSLTVHYDLLLSGAFARLLQRRPKIGLISCQDELPKALRRTYGLDEVVFIKTPGEQVHADTLGQTAVAGRHWPDRFREICAELDIPTKRNGELWLVAAGMLGKIYAAKLKAQGAVVLDIGAVADLWMGKVTRSFPDLPNEVKLLTKIETLTLVDVGGLGGLGEEWLPHKDQIRPILFEPNPSEAQMARAKIADINDGLVIERALSNREEKRTLHVAKSLGCTSLLVPNEQLLAQYTIAPAFHITHEIEVECVRFDDLMIRGEVPQPDAIKIDVQGFEYYILEGFGASLEKCLGVKVEAHLYPIYHGQKLLHDIVDLLGRYSLTLRRVLPVNHFDGDIVEVDAWFTCSAEYAKTLTSARRDKLNFLEQVWEIAPRTGSFGPDQFT